MNELVDPLFNIVLYEPEIPNNTGNIGRTCVGLNAKLHLVGKLGFELTDKYLKRAGLDYWQHLDWVHHKTYEEWMSHVKDPSRIFYFSTKAKKTLFDVEFQRGDWLVFGRETKGLPEEIVYKNLDRALIMPMYGPIRSLNVANAVSIAMYEGIRQLRIKKVLD